MSTPVETPPGPDGFLWQLWEYDDLIVLQRTCDARCKNGLLLEPARFCGKCGGDGVLTRRFPKRVQVEQDDE